MGGRISGEAPFRRSRVPQLGATPAAGAAPTITVPAGHVWRVLSGTVTLVTSATVANRLVRLRWTDGNTLLGYAVAPAVQAASLTNTYGFAEFGPQQAVGTRQNISLPEIVLPAGSTLDVTVDAIDGTDQLTGLTLWTVDTWFRAGPIDWLAYDASAILALSGDDE